MFVRNVVVRAVIRRLLRNSHVEAEQVALRVILDNPDKFNEFVSVLEDQHANLDGGPALDFIKWLIQYVLEHPEEIISLVLLVVTLFGEKNE